MKQFEVIVHITWQKRVSETGMWMFLEAVIIWIYLLHSASCTPAMKTVLPILLLLIFFFCISQCLQKKSNSGLKLSCLSLIKTCFSGKLSKHYKISKTGNARNKKNRGGNATQKNKKSQGPKPASGIYLAKTLYAMIIMTCSSIHVVELLITLEGQYLII